MQKTLRKNEYLENEITSGGCQKNYIIFGDNASKANLLWYNISLDQGNARLKLRTFELKVLNHGGAMSRLKLLTDPTCIMVTNIFGQYF